MEGICSIIAKKICEDVTMDSFMIGSILFGVIKKLKLYDGIICTNEHIMKYAIETIQMRTSIDISPSEMAEVIDQYNNYRISETSFFNGGDIDIPGVLTTDKLKCQVCHSTLTFYNDRQPTISTLYDHKDGSKLVMIFIKINYT